MILMAIGINVMAKKEVLMYVTKYGLAYVASAKISLSIHQYLHLYDREVGFVLEKGDLNIH